MKRLGLALALALWAGPALAQNVTCSTRPAGDSSNACASTAFVTSAVAAGGGGGGGVTSIQGMTGALTCGANMVCSGGVINSGASGSAPALGPAHIFVGNSSAVAADFGPTILISTQVASFVQNVSIGVDDHTNPTTATLTVGGPTSTLPISPIPDTYIQISGDDQHNARLVIDAIGPGTGPAIWGRSARGNVVNGPAPPLSGDAMLSLFAIGFRSGGIYGGAASISFNAAEDHTASVGGSEIKVFTTPLGSLSLTEIARFQPSGGFSVGTDNVTTDPGNNIVRATGLTLSGITGSTQCLQVNNAGTVVGAGTPCGIPILPLLHSHIFVGTPAGISADFGPQVTFADNGLMTFAINTGGVGNFYNVMSSTVPLNTAVIAWRLTDNVNNTVDFGLTGNGAPAPFTGTSFIRSSGNFIIDANTPSAIIFGIGLVEAGRWDQNGHLQLTYLQGGGNQCLTINGAGVVSGTGASCGGSGGGGGGIGNITTTDNTLLSSGTTTVNLGINLAHANVWTATQTLSGLTLSSITGSIQCLHVNAAGVVSGTGSDCGSGGGGGTPGGATTQVQYNNAGVFAGATGVTTNGTALAIGAAVVPDALLTINANTGTTPVAPYTSAAFHIVGADTTFPSVTFDTFGSAVGGGIFLRQANGTRVAPTPTLQNQVLAFIQANGYLGGGAYAVGAAQITFASDDDFSATKNGTKINFYTTARGTNTAVVGLAIQSSGGLSVGNANAAFDPGAGIVLATGARFTGGSTTGATRCLHVDTNGNVSGTASDCGATAVGGGVTGVTSPGGTLTVGGTTGVTVDLNTGHANTWTAEQDFTLTQNGSTLFQASNGSSGTTALAGFQANAVGSAISVGATGSGYTALPILGSGRAFVLSAAVPLVLDTNGIFPLIFGINNVEVARFNGTGLGIQPSGQGVAPDAPLTINANTATAVTPTVGSLLHLVGADSQSLTAITVDAFSSIPYIAARATAGTLAAKLPLAASAQVLNIGGYGWNGSTYQALAAITMNTAEATGPNNNGSNIQFFTNALGVPNVRSVMAIQNSGGLSVGSANVSTDTGNGNIMAGGITVDGRVGDFTLYNLSYAGVTKGALYWRNSTGQLVLAASGANVVDIGANNVITARFQPSGGLSVGSANVSTDGGSGVIVANKIAFTGIVTLPPGNGSPACIHASGELYKSSGGTC